MTLSRIARANSRVVRCFLLLLIALHAMILISVLQKALCRISVGAVFVRSHGWSLYDDIWFLAVPSGGDGAVDE